MSKLSKHIFLLFSSEPTYQKHKPGKKIILILPVLFLISLPVLDLILALRKLPIKDGEMFPAVSIG